MKKRAQIIPTDTVSSRILTIRGQKVILDASLAEIYGVQTKELNRAVKRNSSRFPSDFIFQLTPQEVENLRCQIGTSSLSYGGRRYRPYAFTENGAVMAASVLNSRQAVRMSVFVVRAFVQMRELLSAGSKELARELKQLEAKLTSRLDIHESAIVDVLRRIMELLNPPPAPPVPEKSMGFHTLLKVPDRKLTDKPRVASNTRIKSRAKKL
jgi:phage regulator Rha-like protein